MKDHKKEIRNILEEEFLLIPSKSGPTDLSIVLAYPDIYEYGLPNLGHQCIYAALNQIPYVDISRVYLRSPREFEEKQTLLFAWEKGFPLKEADIIAFTISYEGLFPNVLRILQLADIPLYASERNSSHPLVIAGGPCPTYNPEPLAPFIDAFVIGEGEETLVEVVKTCASRSIMKRKSRKSFLTRLAKIEGIYVPSLIEVSYDESQHLINVAPAQGICRVTKRRQYDAFSLNPARSIIVTSRTIYGEATFSLEITRGCTWYCYFCYIGHGCGKYRSVPVSKIIQFANEAMELNCALKMFFEGTPRSYFNHIVHSLATISKDKKLKLRVGSLRADVIDKGVIDFLYCCGQDNLTVAPETSESLRRNIGKSIISDEMILYGAQLAALRGLKKYAMYFMLGLPGEQKDDIHKIAKLILNSRSILDSTGGSSTILEAHINPFFPKPHTPFQGVYMDSVSKCEEKLNMIIAILKERMPWIDRIFVQCLESTIIGGQEPLKKCFPEHSILIKTIIGSNIHYIQPLLARGSRKMGQVLGEVYRSGLNKEVWYRALQKKGLNAKRYFGIWDTNGTAPWSVISHT